MTCSCSTGHKKKAEDHFNKGEMIPKVTCITDQSISYALYLPSYYNEDSKYPVIFAFDAHGTGTLPVALFQDMAEKYGYIVAGSNNSQNGLSGQQNMHFYDVMSDDVFGRLSIDRNRIYTAGFSGGSRVASSVAIFKGGITGVIGCSAGFPALTQPIQFRFDYLGYVGDEDMNYLEMVTLQDALKQADYRHHLIVFKGKHDWPPKSRIEEAFIWMEANAMKDVKKPIDKHFIEKNLNAWKGIAEAYEKAGDKPQAFEMYQKINDFFNGLVDLKAIEAKISELSASDEVIRDQEMKKENAQKEMSLQSQYIKALNEKNLGWWKDEIRSLNQKAADTTDEARHGILKRLLGYLSLAAYSNANGYLNAGQLDQAGRFIELYAVIDPENNEHAYLAASLYVKKNQQDNAFTSLDLALSLGFTDINRFQNDTVMARLKGDTRYFDFLAKLRK
jgi:poly(3-hydroxybutyrate) depolymerase